jgi:S-formylglutathione hydrolase FrmB
VKSSGWLGAWLVLALVLSAREVRGLPFLGRITNRNAGLSGTLLDFTNRHGADRRIWSEALHQRRDLYVYLPPGFDPAKCYPVMVWLHGIMQDEQSFRTYVIGPLDKAMANGILPPMIVAAPDGTITGRPGMFSNSFFINSQAGCFEDYIIQDVWGFLVNHFPIRPEREAHVLAGASMGGFGAYNLAIKHNELFKVAIGIYPPLNLRWVDCHCRYRGNFDPCCWGWRTNVGRGRDVIGVFAGGLVKVRSRVMLNPLFHRSPDTVARLSEENPAEMILRGQLRPGDLDLFVAYGGRDAFNLDAQVESFLYLARAYGIAVAVLYEPNGRHNLATAERVVPAILDWLAPLVAPYAPPTE